MKLINNFQLPKGICHLRSIQALPPHLLAVEGLLIKQEIMLTNKCSENERFPFQE